MEVLLTRSCPTLSREFSRQEFWSGLPFPYPGDLTDPRIKPRSPALQADSLPSDSPEKPKDLETRLCVFTLCLLWSSSVYSEIRQFATDYVYAFCFSFSLSILTSISLCINEVELKSWSHLNLSYFLAHSLLKKVNLCLVTAYQITQFCSC